MSVLLTILLTLSTPDFKPECALNEAKQFFQCWRTHDYRFCANIYNMAIGICKSPYGTAEEFLKQETSK